MAEQRIRQDARRTVREALDAIRKERLERDRRISQLAIALVTTLAKRDQVVVVAEQKVAATLHNLLAEDLSLSEIAELCGRQTDTKELARLSRIPAATESASALGAKS